MQRWLVACLSVLAGTAAQAASPPEWTRPTTPFHIVGPVYYVGTEGIGVYLIRTREGLILLDTGPEGAVPVVERNIAALGFRLRDVQILLATHAHWDHVAGMAALKRDTGARLWASADDRGALETGIPPSDTDYGVIPFAPVKVDRVLQSLRAVRLGGVAMMPVATPGHTPGCTTWTLRVTERGRPFDVVFPCSISVAGNVLVGNKGYRGIVADFRVSFARLHKVKADVVLTAHPELADVVGRARRRDAGDADAFVAPHLLAQIVDRSQAAFEQDLAKQEPSS